jgi:hypothetical protein
MSESGTLIRRQTARLLVGRAAQGYGTLLLYPDKLAAVRSGAVRAGWVVGFIVVFIPSLLLPPHTGPGALGAVIGVGGGYLIGGAIAKRRADAKVAAGGGGVTLIPLDSITSLETRRSKRWLGGQNLIVTTADGTQYGFGVKLDKWSADLADALKARGCEVRATPQGLAVAPALSAGGPRGPYLGL